MINTFLVILRIMFQYMFTFLTVCFIVICAVDGITANKN